MFDIQTKILSEGEILCESKSFDDTCISIWENENIITFSVNNEQYLELLNTEDVNELDSEELEKYNKYIKILVKHTKAVNELKNDKE